jgi:hypothetical protein
MAAAVAAAWVAWAVWTCNSNRRGDLRRGGWLWSKESGLRPALFLCPVDEKPAADQVVSLQSDRDLHLSQCNPSGSLATN